jgi:hypothetical protein
MAAFSFKVSPAVELKLGKVKLADAKLGIRIRNPNTPKVKILVYAFFFNLISCLLSIDLAFNILFPDWSR